MSSLNSHDGKDGSAKKYVADTETDSDKQLSDYTDGKQIDSKLTKDEEEENSSGCFNVKVFLVLMCFFSITQGFALNGINNVNIPMYERRFGLTSKQTGLEASFYDIIAGCTVLLAGYFGTQFHQPRLLGIASLCLAFGSLTMALPHFITDDYRPQNARPPVCLANGTDTKAMATECANQEQGLQSYLYVLLLGQGLHGLAGTALYTIGPAFIDGSLSSKQSPSYLGIFYGFSALGPAIGYLLGGYFLEQYVDTPKPAPEGVTSLSPVWVGAWWIGFLGSFASCLLLAFPLFAFPRVLPGTARRRRNNVSQAHDHGLQHKADESGFGISIRDMPTAVLLLLKNPVFICQCLIGAAEGLMISGLSTFMPKFISNQFNQTASWASMLTGFVAIPGAAFGQLIGGILVRKFKMKVRDMIKFNLGCSMAAIALLAVFWAKCDQDSIAGVTIGYSKMEINQVNLTDSCNAECGCDTSVYNPVCLNGLEYFTSCHAGCSDSNVTNPNEYVNCGCGNQTFSDLYKNTTQTQTVATHGKCDSKCMMLYVFIPVVFTVLLCTFMMSVPGTTIILRSVNDKQRTLALSMQQMCMRFIGSIPGPLVFGTILDDVCKVWQDKCGDKGSCWIYDTARMGQSFYILTICVKVTSIALLIIAYCLYKPPPPQGDKNSASTDKLSTAIVLENISTDL